MSRDKYDSLNCLLYLSSLSPSTTPKSLERSTIAPAENPGSIIVSTSAQFVPTLEIFPIKKPSEDITVCSTSNPLFFPLSIVNPENQFEGSSAVTFAAAKSKSGLFCLSSSIRLSLSFSSAISAFSLFCFSSSVFFFDSSSVLFLSSFNSPKQ